MKSGMVSAPHDAKSSSSVLCAVSERVSVGRINVTVIVLWRLYIFVAGLNPLICLKKYDIRFFKHYLYLVSVLAVCTMKLALG